MNKQLVLKIMVLLLALVLVLWGREQMGTRTFKQTLDAMFSTAKPKNTLNWCADHVVDFTWVDPNISAELKNEEMAELREKYCVVQTENIDNVDLGQVVWTPLAESHGAAGQKAVLEWNRELGLFKAGGMPFKSSKLAQELTK